MDQIDVTLLGIMGISLTTLIAIAWAELEPSIQKRGGIYFLRFGKFRISFCRAKEQWQ